MLDDFPTDAILAKAFSLRERGRARDALPLFLDAASRGDSTAQHMVGFLFDTGKGTRKNKGKALLWYKRAWKTGKQTDSCMNIAQLYADSGERRRAMFWWQRAVDHGDGDAALDLAKFISPTNKVRFPNLLKAAVLSKHITPAGRDEAKRLLSRFQRRKNT